LPYAEAQDTPSTDVTSAGETGDQASAEIETQALEEARRDPRVNTFLRDVKERGETLDGKGMIHP